EGNLLREVTKNSGYPITKLTEKLGSSRTTLYKKLSLEKLDTPLFIKYSAPNFSKFFVNEKEKTGFTALYKLF
ncbi:MAG: hypothetical protein AAF900_02450, partial [Bacteroidota bacterium]